MDGLNVLMDCDGSVGCKRVCELLAMLSWISILRWNVLMDRDGLVMCWNVLMDRDGFVFVWNVLMDRVGLVGLGM